MLLVITGITFACDEPVVARAILQFKMFYTFLLGKVLNAM